MKTEHHYNDNASDYFILLFLALVTLPSTYVFIKRRVFPAPDASVRCLCRSCKQRDESSQARGRRVPSVGTFFKGAVLVVLWALFIYVLLSVSNKSESPAAGYFDPYAILGLEPGASTDLIKKTYKKLSLIHHPDKADDPTDADVQTRYINIVKAYETLTDDAIRENWEKYGNPDGPQAMSVGIALPSWLVRKDNTFVVLAVYMLLLVVGLPSVVCCWWRSWRKYDTASKVMNSTMGLYYQTLDATARLRNLIEVVAASEEYMRIPLRTSDEKLEKIVKWLPDSNALKKKPKFTAPYAVKSHLLLYAQICRRQADLKANHRADLDFLLTNIRPLIGGLITICTAKLLFYPILEALQLLQSLTQSCWKESPLLQLPHFTEYMDSNASARKYNAPDVTSFGNMSRERRNDFYQKEELEPEQIKDIETVLAFMPTKIYFDYRYEVEGEDSNLIVCGAVVTFFFTVSRSQAALAKALEDAPENDKKKQDKKKNEESTTKRLVHAPYFPEAREECWWVVVGEVKGAGNTGNLVGIHKIGGVDEVADGKIRFLAPPNPGNYAFVVYLICDGYLGFDKRSEFKLRVVKDEAKEKAEKEKLEKDKKKAIKKAEKGSGKEGSGKEGSGKEDGKEEDKDEEDEEDDDDSSFYSDDDNESDEDAKSE